jgi:endosialidase-like protein
MGENSRGLYQLRPVTFRYKQDAQGARQYGLLAEEVAKVYPELVVRGPKGEVESVQYHQLIPMLLNELQHRQHALIAQSAELAELKAQNRRLEAAMQQNTAVAARVAQLEAGATRVTGVAGR